MNAHHNELLPEDFAGDSRVWIYQSPRLFFLSEALEIEALLEAFVQDWKSHGTPVKGYANLFYGQFIVLMADETATGVSGCSTDGSVRLIKEIENKFGVNLFDRLMLAFRIDAKVGPSDEPRSAAGKVQMIPFAQLPYALENGFVDSDTLYFNNTVQTKAELEEKWLIPLKDSWLDSRLPGLSPTAGAAAPTSGKS
ncbi:MAG TPA: hypothetical protein VHW43_14370 [Puia sp.]|jgi:hypothetical protein|nr:hypothetical protein [Puia sp.]